MLLEDLLGCVVALPIKRFAPPGAYLALDRQLESPEGEVILLPRAEVPEGASVGSEVEVFVYLDSEDRPVATTTTPRIVLGEVTFLEVTDVTSFGAFFDWGLPKELLVPNDEQTRDLRVGDRHPIGLYVDDTMRLAGTMRIREMLQGTPALEVGDWVSGEAWRDEPGVGLFVIVERAYLSLVPAYEPHTLTRGQPARFRVTHVQPDRKVELSLRGLAHEELASDAKRLLALLAAPHAPRLGDRSSPETIRRVCGLSKKAFKRAMGRLLKEGAVRIGQDGCFVPVPR